MSHLISLNHFPNKVKDVREELAADVGIRTKALSIVAEASRKVEANVVGERK